MRRGSIVSGDGTPNVRCRESYTEVKVEVYADFDPPRGGEVVFDNIRRRIVVVSDDQEIAAIVDGRSSELVLCLAAGLRYSAVLTVDPSGRFVARLEQL